MLHLGNNDMQKGDKFLSAQIYRLTDAWYTGHVMIPKGSIFSRQSVGVVSTLQHAFQWKTSSQSVLIQNKLILCNKG